MGFTFLKKLPTPAEIRNQYLQKKRRSPDALDKAHRRNRQIFLR